MKRVRKELVKVMSQLLRFSNSRCCLLVEEGLVRIGSDNYKIIINNGGIFEPISGMIV